MEDSHRMDSIRPEVRSAQAPAPAAPQTPESAPAAPRDEVQLGRPFTMVALGDSITAGTQDAITVHDRQAKSYPKQLADHVGVEFNQPLLTEGGIPPRIFVDGTFDQKHYEEVRDRLVKAATPIGFYLRYLGVPSDVSRLYGVEGLGRRDPAHKDTPEKPQHNFAVAGYELRHPGGIGSVRDFLVEMRGRAEDFGGLGQEVPLIHSVLQNDGDQARGSALDQAIARKPDVVMFWAGSNDALETIHGVVDDRTLTPVLSQPWEYWDEDPITKRRSLQTTSRPQPGFWQSIRTTMERLRTETTAEIFVMTIPDVTVIPYLRELGKPVGDLPFRVKTANGTDVTEDLEKWVLPTGVRGEGQDGRKEFPAGSRVGLISLVAAMTEKGSVTTREEFQARLREMSDHPAVWSEWDVLDAAEVREVSSRIGEFNALIRAEAAGPRFHVVDMNRILGDLARNGRDLVGEGEPVRVTATFTGARERGMDGIFSYDGVHPSDTGHAMIANVLLDRMQRDLGDDPRFSFLRGMPPLDEKAAFQADPHRQGADVYLTPAAVEVWRAAQR